MKQGQLTNKIVMLALLGAILAYLGVSVYRSVSDPLLSTICYAYSIDDTVETTGYLVRTEYVLPRQSLIADVLPAEGEKVAKGETVAYLYRDTAALERRSEMRSLALQVEQLEYTMSRAGDQRDHAALTSQIMEDITALRSAVERRSLSGLGDMALDLKSLVYKRDSAFGGGDLTAIQEEIDRLNKELRTLQSAGRQDTTEITAPRPGVFSAMVDGYENLLTPEKLAGLTPSALRELTGQAEPDDGVVGKLITDSRWYYVCTLTEEQAKRLEVGRSLTVRFSRDWAGEVSMEVERLSKPENGEVLAVLSSTRYLSETTLLRRQTVELVFETKSGIRVPREAVRLETRTQTDKETGAESQYQVTGVYVVVGAQAEFKPVTILAEGDDFFLVEAAPFRNPESLYETKKALRAGDEIIIRAEGLYDGKVLQTG